MMRERSDGDCTWIRVYGRARNLIAGITELWGLPYDELMQHPWESGPEDQSPHFESTPSSTSIHFPVYGTPNSIRDMVLQAQVHPAYRRIELPEDSKASRLKLEHADVDYLIKTGFISIYLIPSGTFSEESNAELLGLSFIQNAVRRAANTVKDIAEIVRSWEDEARHPVSNILSSRANDSMERLAIVTIVFLPLTFIASYFSMVKS
nr:uncharacterized protein I203_01717 [Kwoniella mangroviensis CBS 8507]OCF69853.1 hypothetical protein I203_01717 [Kwoniella mangroviensis CBS 8507]